MRAGTVDLTVKFLSPITPKDLTRQSMREPLQPNELIFFEQFAQRTATCR